MSASDIEPRAVFDLAERQSAENKEFKPRPRYAKASLVAY